MTDRRGRIWTPRLLVPAVVVLQIGLFWLAMQIAQHRSVREVPDAPTLPVGETDEATFGDGIRTALVQPEIPAQPPRWLPGLSGPTRTLLTSFQSLPEEAGLTTGTEGPALVAPVPQDAKQSPQVEPAPAEPDRPSWPDRSIVGSGRLPPPEEVLGAATAWPPVESPPAVPVVDEWAWLEAPSEAKPAESEPRLAVEPSLLAEQPSRVEPEAPAPAMPLAKAAPRSKAAVESTDGDLASSRPGIIEPQSPSPIDTATGDGLPAAAERFHPPGETTGPRSEQLERIAQQADRHSRRAFDLAGRGAFYAARSEFIMSLRQVAQGLDADHRVRRHSKALSLGLKALKEAEDFLPRGSRLEADLDLAGIVTGHQTPVLKDFVHESLTPLAAFQQYHTFAQEQLATAAGREVAGSMALQGLGKLHTALADRSAGSVKSANPKAVVFYQAAILVYPQNFMASNELGVLLARGGYFDDARIAMTHSLLIHPQATGWRNLAVVYRQLGQLDLALQAAQRWQVARRAELARGGGNPRSDSAPTVQWMPPETFARSFAATPDEPRGAVAPSAEPVSEPGRPVARQAGGSRWLPGTSNFPN